ncbi:polysaccharide pyruvyl transferase family protein [Mesobacillus subterraneus]|uniref:polysaccharide pyruvyl transferase family protein n=1 Tax=Mesobacillus subterraneus TaxID=285983 RepID=UPI001CFDF2AB|nr:polysaccharide pyruvyl transferase family protein [Mesobacillus subterraneus]
MNNNGHKNKKVGIITFHRAINYGAVLQVYALQEKIKELGAEAVILDYRNNLLEKKHKKRRLSECKSIKDYIRYFLLYKNYNKKFDKFRSFSDEFLNLSKKYDNFDELKKDSESYNDFICGSDQVWNHSITNFDTAYFLDFTKTIAKRNSYAASFGIKSIPDEYKDKYNELLKKFNKMSIREKQGAKIIEEVTQRESEVVLDPTFLISKNDWNKIAYDNLIEDKYILVYAFGGSKHIMSLAEKLSKKTGFKIVAINNNYKKSSNVEYLKSVGPREWLGLFKNAEYILTNSFHGTAFSINFNKEFFTEFLPESHGVNSRLEDILELFNLKHRQILSDNVEICDTNIDFTQVNKILGNERKKSVEFLQKIIDE